MNKITQHSSGPLSIKAKQERVFMKNLCLPLMIGVLIIILNTIFPSCIVEAENTIYLFMAFIAVYMLYHIVMLRSYPIGSGILYSNIFNKCPTNTDVEDFREEISANNEWKYMRIYQHKKSNQWMIEIECY